MEEETLSGTTLNGEVFDPNTWPGTVVIENGVVIKLEN